jgi:hypothetical protein
VAPVGRGAVIGAVPVYDWNSEQLTQTGGSTPRKSLIAAAKFCLDRERAFVGAFCKSAGPKVVVVSYMHLSTRG